MKKILIILLLIPQFLFATNFYFSDDGNDTSGDGTIGSPWKSLTKLGTIWSGVNAGDSILFRRGDTFYGKISVEKSGTAGNHVVLGAYGVGEKPIITGFRNVTGWTSMGGGIYSASTGSSLATCNMVTVDGVQKTMGRTPNAGTWATWDTNGETYITDSDMPAGTWTGSQIFLIRGQGDMRVYTVTGQEGTTVSWASSLTPMNDNRYFFQNSLSTLDELHEWYYDSGTLYMYFGAETPSNYDVKMTGVKTLVEQYKNIHYITFDNIHFKGANELGLYAQQQNHRHVKNCTFDFCGDKGIYVQECEGFKFENSELKWCNNYGFHSLGTSDNISFQNNTIENIGMFYGTGDKNIAVAIQQGVDAQIKNNRIKNIGKRGIVVSPQGHLIENNVIDSFELRFRDGGAIYMGTTTGITDRDTVIIRNNIVMNGIGEEYKTTAYGIYVDITNIYGAKILNNSVFNVSGAGIMLASCQNVEVRNNVVFGCGHTDPQGCQLRLQAYGIYPGEPLVELENIIIKNNQFIAKNDDERIIWCRVLNSAYHADFGDFDDNYYARPIDDNKIIYSQVWGISEDNLTLNEWKSYATQDANTKGSPTAIADTSEIRILYNDGLTPKTFALDVPMIDITGKKHRSSYTLQPFKSVVLLDDPNPSDRKSLIRWNGQVLKYDDQLIVK